eukprot:s185_g2.t1
MVLASTAFHRYSDADGRWKRAEISAYAKGEFSFDLPAENLDRIMRQICGQSEEGIAIDSMQLVKVAVGIAREEEKSKAKRELRLERERKEREEREQKEAEIRARHAAHSSACQAFNLTALMAELQELEPTIASAESMSEAMVEEANAGKIREAQEAKQRLQVIETAVQATHSAIAAVQLKAQELSTKVAEDAEMVEHMAPELAALATKTESQDLALRKALASAGQARQLALHRAFALYEGLRMEVAAKLRVCIETQGGKPDDLYDAVKSAGGGTVTKSAIKAYLEANQSVIEEAHLDTMFPSGPGGSEPSESKEAQSDGQEESQQPEISKEDFMHVIRIFYKVVKEIVLSDNLLIEQSEQLRRMDVGEVMEVFQGPMLDPSVGVYRIHGKALRDGITGWVTAPDFQAPVEFEMAQLWSILPRMAKFSLCGSLRIEGVEGYVLFTRFGISPPPKPGKSYHSARDVDGAKHSEPQDHLPDAGGQPLQGDPAVSVHRLPRRPGRRTWRTAADGGRDPRGACLAAREGGHASCSHPTEIEAAGCECNWMGVDVGRRHSEPRGSLTTWLHHLTIFAATLAARGLSGMHRRAVLASFAPERTVQMSIRSSDKFGRNLEHSVPTCARCRDVMDDLGTAFSIQETQRDALGRFEADALDDKGACPAALLTPLLEQLSPKVYVAFWRQLSFTSAEIYQELFELKGKGKMPGSRSLSLDDDEDDSAVDVKKAARCNELARKAIKHYGIFLESYQPDGTTAEKVEKDHANTYLIGKLNRARLRTKMRGLPADDNIEEHKLALKEYEEILQYGDRNPEVVEADVNMSMELKLCAEMVGLLPTKLARLAKSRSQ